MKLVIDPERAAARYASDVGTGIYVRAADPETGRVGSYDMAVLNKESLLDFLHSRGECNQWAEDIVGILMGHGHLHEYSEEE